MIQSSLMSKPCPHCGKSVGSELLECSFCGIFFEKWYARTANIKSPTSPTKNPSSKRNYTWVAYLVLGMVIFYSGKVIWWKLNIYDDSGVFPATKTLVRKPVIGDSEIPKTTSIYDLEAFIGTWFSDRNKQRIQIFPNHMFKTGKVQGQWYLDGTDIIWRYGDFNSNRDLDRNLISYLREDRFVVKEKDSSQTIFSRLSDTKSKSDWQREWEKISPKPGSDKPTAEGQSLDWRQRWDNLEQKPPPYKYRTFFILSEYQYCPKTRVKYEYRKTYRLIDPETGLFEIHRENLTTSIADMPLELELKYHVPSYQIDLSENPDHPLKNLQIPAGQFQVISGPTHYCRVSHMKNDSHYAAAREWYAPNIPFPIIRWSCEGPSCDINNPPLSDYQLPTDCYYEWSVLKTVKMR